jgi:hypothetical protein
MIVRRNGLATDLPVYDAAPICFCYEFERGKARPKKWPKN